MFSPILFFSYNINIKFAHEMPINNSFLLNGVRSVRAEKIVTGT